MRGRTLEDAYIIFDEAQNTTKQQNEDVFNTSWIQFQDGRDW